MVQKEKKGNNTAPWVFLIILVYVVEFVQTKIGEGFAIFMLNSNFWKTITNVPIVIYFVFWWQNSEG